MRQEMDMCVLGMKRKSTRKDNGQDEEIERFGSKKHKKKMEVKDGGGKSGRHSY